VGLSTEQLAELRKRGKAEPRITIRSPASGVVLEKNVWQERGPWPAMCFIASATLGASGSRRPLRVRCSLRPGRTASDHEPAWASGVTWKGVVQFVYPTVDEKTRAVRARLAFPNAELSFKRDVRRRERAGAAREPPRGARQRLLASGQHRYVFVKRGEGSCRQPKSRSGPWRRLQRSAGRSRRG